MLEWMTVHSINVAKVAEAVHTVSVEFADVLSSELSASIFLLIQQITHMNLQSCP